MNRRLVLGLLLVAGCSEDAAAGALHLWTERTEIEMRANAPLATWVYARKDGAPVDVVLSARAPEGFSVKLTPTQLRVDESVEFVIATMRAGSSLAGASFPVVVHAEGDAAADDVVLSVEVKE